MKSNIDEISILCLQNDSLGTKDSLFVKLISFNLTKITLSVALFLIATPLLADIIYLKNGEAVIGRISGQRMDSVIVRTSTGARTIQKRSIRKISFNTSRQEEQQLKNQQIMEDMIDWQRNLDRILKERRSVQEKKEEEKQERREEERAFFRDETLVLKERTRRNALYRSLVFPGWGQFHKDQDWKGYSFIAATLGAAGAAGYAREAYSTESSNYNASNLQYMAFFYWRHDILFAYPYISASMDSRDSMMSNSELLDGALIFVAVLYGINVIDAYFTDVDLQMGPELSQGGSGRTGKTGSRGGLSPFLSARKDPGGNSSLVASGESNTKITAGIRFTF